MKRIVVLLLCLCMVLPMVFAMTLGAGASTEPTAKLVLTKENAAGKDYPVYYPGENIEFKAWLTTGSTTNSAKDGKDWVGLVAATEDGEPIYNNGTAGLGAMVYKYITTDLGGTGEGEPSVIQDSTYWGSDAKLTSWADHLRENEGWDVDDATEMKDLPAGHYCLIYVLDDGSLGMNGSTVTEYVHFEINYFTVDKTEYLYGESIMVTPLTGSGSNWIGISPVNEDGTINRSTRYIYVEGEVEAGKLAGQGVGTAVDIRAGIINGEAAEPIAHLPAGRYVLYFVASGGFANKDANSEVYIDILGATVEKTEFKYGEPIMVKGYGSGKDWVGIGQLDDSTESGYWSNGSIRWRYIEPVDGKSESETGYGSGQAFDIRQAKLAGAAAARGDIPAGEYVIMVGLDDCYAVDVSSYTHIAITVTAEAPAAPASVSYTLDDARTGLAGGKLTVTFNEADMEMYKKPTKVELYWADENGNALASYNKIGDRKITGATTEIELTDSMVIPAEAKKLMVRAYNGAGTADVVAADLPADRGYRTTGNKVTSFQIVSDMHIGRTNVDGDGVNMSDKHAQLMFADILANDKDSVGIFVAGDAADHGQAEEYARLFSLWQTANETALANDLALPNLYIGVGNHEMMQDTSGHNYSSSYATQMDRFLEYANLSLDGEEKTTTPYYYVNRGGQHFIFLATEYCGTHAYLSNDQLEWLEAKLEAVASDGAPVFIMLHQPLYNTVAGGLANEDGSLRQGWHGVIAGDENFIAWQELVAANGKGTSDHSLMYGQYEAPLREILAQYPSAMMFSGHSHWIMESLGNIYEATEAQPNYMFNTASVSYLWTDNDELNGGTGTAEGSQGYYVTVYENCIEFRGRDFLNGKWIPNAYYRVWLDCAHEYDYECSATCKWCGEDNPDVQSHDGQYDCSTDCKYGCGTTMTDAVPCDGEFECSTTCQYGCGTTMTDAVACSGEEDCSTKCQYCSEAVTPRVSTHSFAYLCTALCGICGEANPDVIAHDGENDCDTTCRYCQVENTVTDAVPCSGAEECSTKCQYCGEAVTPLVNNHTFTYACTDKCTVCGEDNPDVVPCSGAEDCSTKCQYCGEAVTPLVNTHSFTYVCDDTCSVCGEEITHEEHDGLYDCSDKCQWCGIDVDHEEHVGANGCETECMYGCGTPVQGTGHEGEFACSNVCKNCNEPIQGAAHEGKADCATVCKYGCGESVIATGNHTVLADCATVCKDCGEAMTATGTHTGEYACSPTCKNCGEEIAHEEHDGLYECSTTCKHGCGTVIEDAVPCDGAVACAVVCRYCGEETVTDAVPCEGLYECSVNCQYCNEPVEHAEHKGKADCATLCKYGCGESVTATGTHAGEFACSNTCAACGEAVTPAEHERAFECSTTCKYGCGTELPGAVPHDGAFDCSTICIYCDEKAVTDATAHDLPYACTEKCLTCDEDVEHLPCTGAVACAIICQYCGEETAENVVPCDGAVACDTVCKYCGEETVADAVPCDGAWSCSEICKYCGEKTVDEVKTGKHTQAHRCSETCKLCGEPIAEPKAHTYSNACDDSCELCGKIRVIKSAHKYANTCDVDCDYCGYTRTVEGHRYTGACDADCNICGAKREVGDHTFGDWVTATEATTAAAGLETRSCTVCGLTELNELPILEETPDLNDANQGEKINVPLIGEMDKDSFFIAVAVVAAAVVLVILNIAIISSKKRKKKKLAKKAAEEAAKAEPEEAFGVDETPEVEEAVKETPEEVTEETTEEATEETAEEAIEEAPAEEADDQKDGE